jgi:hypothetical protein
MRVPIFIRTHPFDALMVLLVALIFVSPLEATTSWGGTLAYFGPALLPLACVVALAERRGTLIAGCVLAVPATMAIVQDYLGLQLVDRWIVLTFPLGIYILAALVIVARVMRNPSPGRQTLMGAVCGYLMLGYVWAVAYTVLDLVVPDAFHGTAGEGGAFAAGEAIYYSFVTLTTLGYGDIYPLTGVGRSLAILEAMAGVMYLALLVASLVGAAAGRAAERVADRAGDE